MAIEAIPRQTSAEAYAGVMIDEAAFAAGVAGAGASRSARQWSAGANWYASPWVRWSAMFERTVFGPRSARVPEDVVGVRFQLAF